MAGSLTIRTTSAGAGLREVRLLSRASKHLKMLNKTYSTCTHTQAGGVVGRWAG